MGKTISQTSCYRWAHKFKNGQKNITDELGSGRPVDVSAKVEKLIKSNRRFTIDDVLRPLTIHMELHTILSMRN